MKFEKINKAAMIFVVLAMTLIVSSTAYAMQIFIITPYGKTVTLEVEPTDDVANVKAKSGLSLPGKDMGQE